MAKQLAALAPTPDYSLGSMSKPAIVSGGTENTTYLSVLYGLIMRKMTNMNAVRSSPGTSVIFFALDENGNILHVAIEKASGFPDIDAQTMEAVRRAAPFPPPPRDIPHRFFFSRDVERGR
jgi:protein TonB